MSNAQTGAASPALPAVARQTRPYGTAAPRPPWRVRGRIVAALVLALLIVDRARPPAQQLTARGLLGAIHLYQATLSPRLGQAGVRCRFTPTCSHYAEGAIRKDGALVGSLRAAWRVLRCGPWTKRGTYDPP